MKKSYILIICLIIFILNISGSDIIRSWTLQPGTTELELGSDIIIDAGGNILVAGYTRGDLDGNTNAGFEDYFISKYTWGGDLLYTIQHGSTKSDYVKGITLDTSGNIYITGSTQGDLDGNISQGTTDLFISKYTPSGTRLWTTQRGTSSMDMSNDIAVDSTGNIYIVGYTYGDLGGTGNAGNTDIFLMKFNNDGNFQWTVQFGTPGWDIGNGITIDNTGNIYIAGYCEGDLYGEVNSGSYDAFISKYNSSGARIWTRLTGTTNGDTFFDIEHIQNGTVCASGHFNSTGSSNNELVIYTSDTDGNLSQIERLSSYVLTTGQGIAVDKDFNLYVTGITNVSVDSNPIFGLWDIFTVKYNTSNTRTWSAINGTAEYDQGYDLAVDLFGNIYVTGETTASLDGNTYHGNSDIVIIKYGVIYDIEGSVTDGTNPMQGVTINLTGDSTADTVTDINGDYCFNGLVAGGTYVITPVKKHWTFSPISRIYPEFNGSITDADFSYSLNHWDISGTVKDGSTPLEGISVSLTGGATLFTTTNANGYFSFADLPAGERYIIPLKDKFYGFIPETYTIPELSNSEEITFNVKKVFADDLSNLKTYPNPYKPGLGIDYIIFNNLTKNSEIKIYTIQGELICTLFPDFIEYKWDLKNDAGNKVSAGVYLYVVTSPGSGEKQGKIAILR
ncbi:MAG: SBBP repeat-containing protein [bacterium]|nr:SBBP repeat-containing protein [bacterium]